MTHIDLLAFHKSTKPDFRECIYHRKSDQEGIGRDEWCL